MDDQEQDSMGKLPSTFSRTAMSKHEPNARPENLLGTEFDRAADAEVVNRALMRLVAVFGNPWGADDKFAKVMRGEWQDALADMPAVTIDRAVSDWVRGNTKWPRPFDIRELADAHQRARAATAGAAHKVHPARIVPDDDMRAATFVLTKSALRSDQTWLRFLDLIHPMHEHYFFTDAKCRAPHEVFGISRFVAEQIDKKWGKQLTDIFKRPVALSASKEFGANVTWTDEPYKPPTAEAIARVSELVAKFTRRGENPEAKVKASKLNLDGASQEFLDLMAGTA
jgi:hypothetical protein